MLIISRINYAHIVLSPKIDGANKVNQFRPISLLNCSFKIFMKVLANRHKKVINLLIDKTQSGFNKDRFILDNVAIAQEIIFESHHFNKGGALLKLDFEKAYDKVD